MSDSAIIWQNLDNDAFDVLHFHTVKAFSFLIIFQHFIAYTGTNLSWDEPNRLTTSVGHQLSAVTGNLA